MTHELDLPRRPVWAEPVSDLARALTRSRSCRRAGRRAIPRGFAPVASEATGPALSHWSACRPLSGSCKPILEGSGGEDEEVVVRRACKLFPGTGPHGVDACLDLGALTGDGVAGRLVADVAAAWRPNRVASLLDAWLCDRLLDARAAGRVGRYGLACEALVRGLAPGQAAEAAGVSLRQLQRWTRQAIGIGPGQIRDLARLQASLRAVQLRRGDPVDGYSDQAHQIRSWKRRLGVTPDAYRRRPPSMMATLQARDRSSEERIHYL